MRMAQTTIAPPIIRTLADLRKRLGNIPLDDLPGLVVPLGDLFDSIRRRRKS
jgi:hypothetical protein